MKFRQFSWTLWTVGTIIILLSWMKAVPATVGWVGFGIAFLGTILSGYAPRQKAPARPGFAQHPATSTLQAIEKLADLRDKGAISESEFSEKKKALLDQVGGKPPETPPQA